MKKLRLDPDALVVEPFETGAARHQVDRTVRGFEMETRRQDSCDFSFCCEETRLPRCSVTGLCG